MRARLVGGAIELACQGPIEDFVHQRRLPRAAHAGHGDEDTERDRDVDVFQVVLSRTLDDDLSARVRTTVPRRGDRLLAAQVCAGQRAMAVLEQPLRRTLENQPSAMLTGPGAEIND